MFFLSFRGKVPSVEPQSDVCIIYLAVLFVTGSLSRPESPPDRWAEKKEDSLKKVEGLTLEEVLFVRRNPRQVRVVREVAQLKVRDGETNNRGLIELTGDCRRKRQQFGQLVKFEVFFPSPRPRRISAFLLTHLQDAVMNNAFC